MSRRGGVGAELGMETSSSNAQRIVTPPEKKIVTTPQRADGKENGTVKPLNAGDCVSLGSALSSSVFESRQPAPCANECLARTCRIAARKGSARSRQSSGVAFLL